MTDEEEEILKSPLIGYPYKVVNPKHKYLLASLNGFN